MVPSFKSLVGSSSNWGVSWSREIGIGRANVDGDGTRCSNREMEQCERRKEYIRIMLHISTASQLKKVQGQVLAQNADFSLELSTALFIHYHRAQLQASWNVLRKPSTLWLKMIRDW